MTTAELIAILVEYPADTPVFVRKGYALHAYQVTEMSCDDWDNATRDDEGNEVPARGIAVHIGSTF